MGESRTEESVNCLNSVQREFVGRIFSSVARKEVLQSGEARISRRFDFRLRSARKILRQVNEPEYTTQNQFNHALTEFEPRNVLGLVTQNYLQFVFEENLACAFFEGRMHSSIRIPNDIQRSTIESRSRVLSISSSSFREKQQHLAQKFHKLPWDLRILPRFLLVLLSEQICTW